MFQYKSSINQNQTKMKKLFALLTFIIFVSAIGYSSDKPPGGEKANYSIEKSFPGVQPFMPTIAVESTDCVLLPIIYYDMRFDAVDPVVRKEFVSDKTLSICYQGNPFTYIYNKNLPIIWNLPHCNPGYN